MTSTSSADPPTSDVLPVNKEDAAMFGDACTEIGDALQRSVDQALDAGVATLPLLSTDASQRLANYLKHSYYVNVDTFELYIARNIFSVAMFPPSRRAAVVGLFLDDNADLSTAETTSEVCSTKNNDDTEAHDENKHPLSRKDIPTQAQIQQLQSEIQFLTDRLNQMQLLKANLQQSVTQVEMAHQLAKTAQQTTAPIPKLATAVEASFQTAQTLGTILQDEAPRVAQRMQDIKRQRITDSSSHPNLHDMAVVPTLSLQPFVSEKRSKQEDDIPLSERYRLDAENVVPHSRQIEQIYKLVASSPSPSKK